MGLRVRVRNNNHTVTLDDIVISHKVTKKEVEDSKRILDTVHTEGKSLQNRLSVIILSS